MYKNIGFIGSGNMATAIIGGAVKSGFLKPENIYISDIDKTKVNELVNTYGVVSAKNNLDLVKKCDILVLSIKPHIYETVLNEIKEHIDEDMLIITIAAGITIGFVKNFFKHDVKVIRTMPNTPALVGEGMTAIAYTSPVGNSEVNFVKELFSSFGLVEIMDESMIDAFTALCGSSPAFVDIFIEAMADAAVLLGFSRNKAYIMASQVVKGSAKMVIETKKHPGELKDMVCSPKGTTIEGVRILEQKGFRSSIIEAVIKTAEKAKAIGK